MINHLWNRIIINKDTLTLEDTWKIKHIRNGDHFYVPLATPIQLLYTMAQLRNCHEQFALKSATKLYDLLKTAGTKAIASKTLENLEYLVLTCDP